MNDWATKELSKIIRKAGKDEAKENCVPFMFMILLFAPATQYYICATKQRLSISMIVAAHYPIGYMLCLMALIEANAHNIWITLVYLCGP